MLARVRGAQERVWAVSGTARVDLSGVAGITSTTAVAAARAPQSVRLILLDFIGVPRLRIVSDGTCVEFFADGMAETFYGPLHAPQLRRLVPFDISIDDLASVLLGRAPKTEAGIASASHAASDRTYHLELADGASWEIDPDLERVRRAFVPVEGGVELSFGSFEDTDGITFPEKISMSSPRGGVAFTWNSYALNDRVSPELFKARCERPSEVPSL